jgi:hypothetical protein
MSRREPRRPPPEVDLLWKLWLADGNDLMRPVLRHHRRGELAWTKNRKDATRSAHSESCTDLRDSRERHSRDVESSSDIAVDDNRDIN